MVKILKTILISVLIAIMLSAVGVSAATPYQTYTYSYSGATQISPAAYDSKYEVYDFGEAGSLKSPSQMIYDKQHDWIIIADTGNSRIVIVNSDFKFVAAISTFNNNGIENSLREPQGVFMTDDGYLYIADTQNSRILIFDDKLQFFKELPPLSADILPKNFRYNPKSIAVDGAKNVYVVSINTNMGVITLDPEGGFGGFIGAQRVSINPLELVKRSFMTEAQLERTSAYVPVEYNNLSIDEKGFIYVTCSQINRYDLYTSIWGRSTSSVYAPLKKLNPSGTDVLRRNGFFPPVGDIGFDAYPSKESIDPSQITEIKLLENGMYSLLDSDNNKVFTYDSAGNLLYAFGGFGEATGLYTTLVSHAYNGNYMYTLDSSDNTITVLSKTEYALLLDEVIGYHENREYDKASTLWKNILSENNNFDIAYLGMGKIYMENGNYEKAMDYFRLIDNKNYYSKAFKLNRQEYLDKYGVVVFAVILAAVFLIYFILRKVSRYNKKTLENPPSGKFKDELIYGFYTILHPFQGYWGLKYEKRGTVRAATTFLVLTGLSAVFSQMGACYLQKDGDTTIVSALSNTVFPLLLWCVSNVCFTSLMDGKGRFKDVYIAACYSTVPYIMVMVPMTLISYVMVADELSILALITSFGMFWTIALLLLSTMTVHDYSFGKNLVVIVLTVAGIAFILFILLIFISLAGRMTALVSSIISEISYRP